METEKLHRDSWIQDAWDTAAANPWGLLLHEGFIQAKRSPLILGSEGITSCISLKKKYIAVLIRF